MGVEILDDGGRLALMNKSARGGQLEEQVSAASSTPVV